MLYIPFLMLIALMFLCGFDFWEKKVAMDTEAIIVYQTAEAGDILEAFAKDKDKAKERYNDRYFAVYGVILSKKDNSREFILGTGNKTDKNGIVCQTADKGLIETVKGMIA